MGAVAGMAWVVYVVVLAGAVVRAPSWYRAAMLGMRLGVLRDELVGDTLTDALPRAEPVTDLLATIEHLHAHHRRLRLVDLLAYDAIDRYGERRDPTTGPSVHPVPVLAFVGAPVRVRGLGPGEQERLRGHGDRLNALTAGLVLTTSWSGLATVAWFMVTGRRGPRAAIAAVDRARIGRAARRGVTQIRHA